MDDPRRDPVRRLLAEAARRRQAKAVEAQWLEAERQRELAELEELFEVRGYA